MSRTHTENTHMPTATAARPLTPRMHDLCRAITTLTERRGFPPSLHEVAAVMGVNASRVQRLAVDAEARGAIVREARIPRSLRVAESVPASTRRR